LSFDPREFLIRPATPGDRAAIVSLYLELEDHHRVLQPSNARYNLGRKRWDGLVARFLADPSVAMLVAATPDVPVGFAKLMMVEKPWGLSCEIDTMVVSTRFRGRGIGRRLMDAAEAYARTHEAKAMRVTVLVENGDGRRFYEREGYGPIAVRYGKPVGRAGIPGEA
jgi:ribosomal protein S18 acetylase RimI-like enzyme